MKLYDYQKRGVDFLISTPKAYLADVPGLGKTAQAVRAAEYFMVGGTKELRTMVVCPAVAIPVWKREWRLWCNLPLPEIVSYTKLAMWERNRGNLAYQPPDILILDEAHYVKSHGAMRTKAALGIACCTERVWLLSGSPMPNDPRELYTVFNNLWPERIPPHIKNRHQWLDHFCKWYTADWGVRVTGSKNMQELADMLGGGPRGMRRPIMLRRRVQDVGLQLPPLRLHVVPLPADADFAGELETYIQEHRVHTATVRRLLGAHKAPRIAKIVGDEKLSPIVLMYHHKDTGRELRHRLIVRGWRCYGFDGSHTPEQRAYEVERFQSNPKGPKCMIVQQQAGGVAITLTAAAEIILVEPDWSPEANAQAIKRVHRIGSDRPVRARIFSVEGSLDEAIMETLAKKIRMRKELLDGLQG